MKIYVGAGLPVGLRRRAVRPSILQLTVRLMDRLITRVQEWLEAPDKTTDKILAYIIITLALIYFAAQLVQLLV